MCYKLTAEKILLNYFAEHEQAEEISFQELGNLSAAIVDSCHNSILSGTTSEDIRFAARKHSELIEIQDAKVKFVDPSRRAYVKGRIHIYNSGMPSMVMKNCIEICGKHEPHERKNL